MSYKLINRMEYNANGEKEQTFIYSVLARRDYINLRWTLQAAFLSEGPFQQRLQQWLGATVLQKFFSCDVFGDVQIVVLVVVVQNFRSGSKTSHSETKSKDYCINNY